MTTAQDAHVACPDEQTVADFVEGRLGAPSRADVVAHVDGCDGCRELVAATILGLGPAAGGAPESPVEPSWTALSTPAMRVDRYVLLDRVGAGAMGVVYSAYDPELDRRVALKLVKTESSRQSAHLQARLQREARAVARVSHPNVVTVHDVGVLQSRVFIAMEFVDGRTLTKWLAEAKPDWSEIVAVLAQAGRGLAAAHAVGLIHRDFKPDNVLVGRDGRVRVTDFGLARGVGVGDGEAPLSGATVDTTLTATGAVLGTPACMSPEQKRGERLDARADVFSFAVTAYQALFGVRPFAGESVEALGRAIATQSIVPPTLGGRPAFLRRALERGLKAAPDERWPTMELFLAALEPSEPRRGRWLAVPLVCAVVALAGVVVARREGVAPCRGAPEKLASVWSPARRALVGGAGSASLAATVDRYGAAWVRDRTEACEATRVHGEQSEQTLDLRIECLDQRLHELDALLTTVVEEKVGAATAEQAAYGLTPVAQCDAVAALRRIDRDTPAAVRGPLLDEAAHVRALVWANVMRALPAAQAFVERVRQKGADDILPTALYYLANAENLQSSSRAATTLRETVLASAAVHDDTTLARALIRLVSVETDRAGYDEAERAARYAERIVTTLDRPDTLAFALELNMGMLRVSENRGAEAEEHLRKARTILEHEPSPAPLVAAQLATRLSMVASGNGRFAEAANERRRAMAPMAGAVTTCCVRLLSCRKPTTWSSRSAWSEAVPLTRHVLAEYVALAPRFQEQTEATRNDLGCFLVEAGHYAGARCRSRHAGSSIATWRAVGAA